MERYEEIEKSIITTYRKKYYKMERKKGFAFYSMCLQIYRTLYYV